ncbi:hypothetical protein ABZZ80_32325, partial [Streptomyces sp. NPDC006356]
EHDLIAPGQRSSDCPVWLIATSEAVIKAAVIHLPFARSTGLLPAVRERPKGQSMPAALREHAPTTWLAATDSDAGFTAFTNLVAGTPAQRNYAQDMRLRHTAALTQANAEESSLAAGGLACTAMAHFALEAPRAAYPHDNPHQAITRAFGLLEHGWSALAQIKALKMPETASRPERRELYAGPGVLRLLHWRPILSRSSGRMTWGVVSPGPRGTVGDVDERSDYRLAGYSARHHRQGDREAARTAPGGRLP